jgi:hypothetical protein
MPTREALDHEGHRWSYMTFQQLKTRLRRITLASKLEAFLDFGMRVLMRMGPQVPFSQPQVRQLVMAGTRRAQELGFAWLVARYEALLQQSQRDDRSRLPVGFSRVEDATEEDPGITVRGADAEGMLGLTTQSRWPMVNREVWLAYFGSLGNDGQKRQALQYLYGVGIGRSTSRCISKEEVPRLLMEVVDILAGSGSPILIPARSLAARLMESAAPKRKIPKGVRVIRFMPKEKPPKPKESEWTIEELLNLDEEK